VSNEPTPPPLIETDLKVLFIERAPLFHGLSRGQCGEVAARARDRRVKRKQAFFREGEPAHEVSVLCVGRVKMTQISPGGRQVILRLVGPGEVVGGLGLPSGCAYPATAEALEASHTLSWEKAALAELLERIPLLGRNALRIMGERLRGLEERYCELATERVPQRLARVLIRLMGQIGRPSEGGVLISLSREELAQMTGTTIFTVSRLLSHWESLRMVQARREGALIDDPSGLIGIAEDFGETRAGLNA